MRTAYPKLVLSAPGLTLWESHLYCGGKGASALSSQGEVIETTVSEVAAELVTMLSGSPRAVIPRRMNSWSWREIAVPIR
jgi:hypothetical protein